VRILSLLPSATEIVFALGQGAQLVGRSAECDYPSEARRLPIVMEAKVPVTDRPSAEVDADVRATRGRGESLYRLNLDLLTSLRPELILTQDLCGVCSVTSDEVLEACRTVGLDPAIVALTPRDLEEVWSSVETIGRAMGVGEAAGSLASELRRRCRPVTDRASARPRVAVVEWLDPPILAGLWTPDVVARAGGAYVGPRSGQVGLRTDWVELLTHAPELVIISPCSYAVERTWNEIRDSSLGQRLRDASVPLGVWVADEAHFSRPGPRLADGVELVRALLAGDPPSGALPVRRWEAVAPESAA
jgi:iron complex transport system substrate-binding protein